MCKDIKKEEYIRFLEDVANCWEVKWTNLFNDRIALEFHIDELKKEIREIKDTKENADTINDMVNYWAEKWSREHNDKIQLEERLKSAEATIRLMKWKNEEEQRILGNRKCA